MLARYIRISGGLGALPTVAGGSLEQESSTENHEAMPPTG